MLGSGRRQSDVMGRGRTSEGNGGVKTVLGECQEAKVALSGMSGDKRR